MLDLEAHLHNSIPYVHISFSTVLQMRSLFSNDGEGGGVFSYEPVYLASFEIELLAFRCHVVLPMVKVKEKYFKTNMGLRACYLLVTL